MNALAALGVGRGDPILVMLPRVPAWHVAMVAGAEARRTRDPLHRHAAREGHCAIGRSTAAPAPSSPRRSRPPRSSGPASTFRSASPLGGAPAGWHDWDHASARSATHGAAARTRSDEPALCFYTSGTTSHPKAVLHAHAYTFAHRWTGEYWLDLQRTDLHWTTADTGWAKAAYGVLFGPWMNGVPIFMYQGRFDPERELDLLARYEVSTFCAPPTEYRLLVAAGPGRPRLPRLRHCTGAGRAAQPRGHLTPGTSPRPHSSTTATGRPRPRSWRRNLPVLPIRPGSMGKPFPGHDLARDRRRRRRAPVDEVGDLALRGRPPVAVPRVLEESGRDRDLPAGRLVPAPATGPPRRGRLLLVRRAAPTTSSSRPATGSDRSRSRARCSSIRPSSSRRSWRAPTPVARRDREGVRRASPGQAPGDELAQRASGPREAGHRAVQVSARDRVRRRTCRRP